MDNFYASVIIDDDIDGAVGGSVETPGPHQQQHIDNIRFSVRPPAFFKSNPVLWFLQMEAHFEINRLISDRTRYNAIVASIDSLVLAQVSDIVFSPPETDKYITLKRRILDRFAESDESRLKKLLTGLSLGDRKPSHLLREMKELAGSGLSTAALKSLWLQRLPTQCQAILSVSHEPLDAMSALADKICEVSFSEVYALSPKSGSSEPGTLENKFDNLLNKFQSLEKQISNLSRAKSPVLTRLPSRSPSRLNPKTTLDKSLCWYHRKFSDRAAKCIKPCNFRSHPEN